MTQTFKPLKGQIFVTDLEGGMRKTLGGILLPDDNLKDHGIRQRWCRVALLGEDVTDVKVGEWILLPHGRWTLKIPIPINGEKTNMWKIDPEAILLVSEVRPDGLAESSIPLPSL